ncbi:hypothetical protein BDZ45DRAFT_277432 [Acephala macrosclerotiorum]|nr:hypothetical protein BDZ45DRAFT_277432 [Acephala macrosclerotiorum]
MSGVVLLWLSSSIETYHSRLTRCIDKFYLSASNLSVAKKILSQQRLLLTYHSMTLTVLCLTEGKECYLMPKVSIILYLPKILLEMQKCPSNCRTI